MLVVSIRINGENVDPRLTPVCSSLRYLSIVARYFPRGTIDVYHEWIPLHNFLYLWLAICPLFTFFYHVLFPSDFSYDALQPNQEHVPEFSGREQYH